MTHAGPGRGKTLLITGGSRGIGAATARLAGARGWAVTLTYRSDAESAQSVVAEVEAAGGRALALRSDAADEGEIAGAFDAAESAFGPVDAVSVNAGIIGPGAKLAEMDPARIRRVIETNVVGALLTAREAARRMTAGGVDGAIVLLSSAAARRGGPNEFVDYAASKGAMDTLCVGLAQELAPKIRVNAVRPGLIETDIHADTGWATRAQDMGASVPLARAGSAEEVAEGIVWLLSDAASYVTGANLDIAGGR